MTNKKEKGFLYWVEKTGNKIPHPFVLFLYLLISISLISFLAGSLKLQTVNPTNDEIVAIKNVLSNEGLSYFFLNLIKNFIGFAPLGLVLTMTLGLGVAEESGLMSAFMRNSLLSVPPRIIAFSIMIIGICGNIASDAAVVIIPALSGVIFLYLNRNPIAGIILGFAATTAGFTANLIIAGTDALLAGITNEAAKIVSAPEIPVTANWFIMIVSTFLLAIIGTIVNNKIIEPRLGKYTGSEVVKFEEVNESEKSGLKSARNVFLSIIIAIIVIAIPQGSFLRNAKTGSLIQGSVLIKGIVPILLFTFLATSYAFGRKTGSISRFSDMPDLMSKSIKKMSSFIVLAFVIGQFVAIFKWTNMGLYLAIVGANALIKAGFTGISFFVSYILLTSFINLFIGSGSAKWALLAPVFVPMMYLMGYHPAWAQFLYRVGDSTTNIISPLFPYFPIVLSLVQRYDKKAGTGTLLSLSIPYSITFLIAWIVFAIIWYLAGLPLGIGGQILL